MSDAERARDTESPDGMPKGKPKGPKNRPRSNRVMLVVVGAAVAVLVFIITSMGGSEKKSSAPEEKYAKIGAASTGGLTLTPPKEQPIEFDEPKPEPPEIVLTDDGKLKEKKDEPDVKIVMKEPSAEYKKHRDMMLAGMASRTAVPIGGDASDIDDGMAEAGERQSGYGDDTGRPSIPGMAASESGGRTPFSGARGGGDDVAMAHQDRNVDFIESKQQQAAGMSAADEYNPWTRRDPVSRYELKAGTVISGVLTSGINSDLPGNIVAQVSENIYDTATGAHLLIPMGAKILGEYDSHVVYGQNRILVVWNRIIFPDGTSLNIGGMLGSDQAGYSGFKQKVDNHYSRMIGAALFASVFVAAGKIATENDKDKDGKESVAAETVMEQMTTLGARIAERNLNVAPTLRILPGYRFSILTTKDMAFAEPYIAHTY